MNGAVTVYVCENFACQAPLVGWRRWSGFLASGEHVGTAFQAVLCPIAHCVGESLLIGHF